MRLAGLLLLVCCFAAGALFSIQIFNMEAPKPVSQSASVAAAEIAAAQSAFANVSLFAQGAIVVDLHTHVVLYQRNADAQLSLASITKVPLAIVVSEVLVPESIVTIPKDTSYNSKASQLLAGERWRTKDLMTYTLMASSNDGAEILANAADEALRAKYPQATGSATVWRMNDLARALNLQSMYFLNPTGLDVSETQSGAYGSARDVAKLFTYAATAMPALFESTATSSAEIMSLDGRVAQVINTDKALEEIPGMVMGKTGLTDLAGGNLAVIFSANGKRYAAVVLGSTEEGRFSDIQQLTAATRSVLAQNK